MQSIDSAIMNPKNALFPEWSVFEVQPAELTLMAAEEQEDDY